mgnify:CR=1 FL=1
MRRQCVPPEMPAVRLVARAQRSLLVGANRERTTWHRHLLVTELETRGLRPLVARELDLDSDTRRRNSQSPLPAAL